MISAQCDELRNLALWLDDEFYDAEASKVRQAADTIWELRCKLAGVVDQQGEIERLKNENARLRESVRNLLTCVKHEECEESCPNYSPAYSSYGYERHGSIVIEDEYLGCCLAGLENCNSMLFDADEYLHELGIEAMA